MHLSKIGKRLASLAAVGAIVAATSVSLASPASAVPLGWWLFRNVMNGTCLSVTSTGGAVQAVCNFDDPRQLWDWAGESVYTQLRNQDSNRCLVTDHKNAVNAVWTTLCARGDAPDGMRWRAGDGPNSRILLLSYLGPDGGAALRTSPNRISIYTDDYSESDWAEWRAFPG